MLTYCLQGDDGLDGNLGERGQTGVEV